MGEPGVGGGGHELTMREEEVQFWVAYEDRLGSKLPMELKVILTFMGYSCKAAMKKFDEKDIQKIETFVREKLHKLIDQKDIVKYYGVFHANPNLFEIMGGFQHVLEAMAEFARKSFPSVQSKRRNEPADGMDGPAVETEKSPSDPSAPGKTYLNEISHLQSMFSKWIEENVKDIEIDYETLPIVVERSSFGGLSCRISCPVAECTVQSRGNKNGSRWNHNFYKHVKTHMKRKRSDQETVCSLFTKKKKTDINDVADVNSDKNPEQSEVNKEGGNTGGGRTEQSQGNNTISSEKDIEEGGNTGGGRTEQSQGNNTISSEKDIEEGVITDNDQSFQNRRV